MIRMNDFAAEPDALRRDEAAAVERVFRSGAYILGPELEKFEAAWAEVCGADFCAGVANGLEAIQLGLRALDIGPGDEVVTTAMTAMPTILAIIHAGAIPVLADIDISTAILDPESVQRCLTPRTKAILLVHLYGRMTEMKLWVDLCESRQIHLIEDCAQAHGAVRHGLHAGTFGSWGAYSFYPTKNLGAKGDAGALITNYGGVATRIKTLRNCGAGDRYEHREVGLNSRLDEIQAAILCARLNWLNRFNARRRQIAERYFAEIKNARIELLRVPDLPESHVYHLFVVRCRERNRLKEFLRQNEIETLIHYPIPAHEQVCCSGIRRDPNGLEQAEQHAKQCLSLPVHPQLDDEEVRRVIAAVNQFE